MISDTYFDMRNLAFTNDGLCSCPVAGCTATLETVDSQWGKMPYCPVHRIRIHLNSKTFAYHNGPIKTSEQDATLRNILFERDYFKANILDNAAKAETHRMGHETSEDAVTWNVFSKLAREGLLSKALSNLLNLDIKSEPELYLWGLKIRLDDFSAPSQFPALENARQVFENNITRFLTEPDIMLYVPGQILVLIEAKFTSGNTIALDSSANDLKDEKPKSRGGILKRYPLNILPQEKVFAPTASEPFYSQLYRNLVFATYMANMLGVRWGLINLISEEQFSKRKNKVEFQDPTHFIHSLLPEQFRDQFLFYSWERLYNDQIVREPSLSNLAEYIFNKSANGAKAFKINGNSPR